MNIIEQFNPLPTQMLPSYHQSESMLSAEDIFKNFNIATEEKKAIMTEYLDKAYQAIDLEVPATGSSLQLASRIYYLYGRRLYGGDFLKSSKMFEMSLLAQALSLQKLEEPIYLPKMESLAQYVQSLENNESLAHLPNLIAHKVDWVEKMELQDDKLNFELAEKLRWLGHCYQNISRYQTSEQADFFEKIYNTSVKILAQVNTLDANWEIGQIHYNTSRFVHKLKYPQDLHGALETLKGIERYFKDEQGSLRAKTLQAQIYNIQMVEGFNLFKKEYVIIDEEIEDFHNLESPSEKKKISKQEAIALYEEFYRKISLAAEIANTTEGFNIFLKTLFSYNKASMAFDCYSLGSEIESLENIEKSYRSVYEIMKEEKFNHDYHSNYLTNIAKFKEKIGKKEESSIFFAMAALVTKKFANNKA